MVKLNDKTKGNKAFLPFFGFVLQRDCDMKSKSVGTNIIALYS